MTDVTATPASSTDTEVIVSVRNLKKHFPIMGGLFRRQVNAVRAVDGVSFDIHRGETLGLFAEAMSQFRASTWLRIVQMEFHMLFEA